MAIEECCGCGVCATRCPVDAIIMKDDEEGFAYALIDEQRCINCGKCKEICQFKKALDQREEISEPINLKREIYIGRHCSIEIVKKSRSGGIFTALSDYVLSIGGLVYGAVLNDDFTIEHIEANNQHLRDSMRGSKYSQSCISSDLYRRIKDRLLSGRLILFTGTSCQVAALRNYLQKDYKNLLTMDIVCHGVESPVVLREYIKEWEKNEGAKCTKIDFREKLNHGWSNHIERIFFKQDCNEFFYIDSEIYKNLFYGHLSLRPSCYICPYKSQEHPGDITVGDCWGIDKIDERYADDIGCSIIFVNSRAGREILQRVSNNLDIKKTFMCNELFQPALSEPFKVDPNERFVFWGKFIYGNKKAVMEQYGNGKFEKDYYMDHIKKVDKRSSIEVAFQVLDKIMCMMEENISVSDFFEDNRINTVAIYGFGKMGRHIYYLLDHAAVNVEYAIDKQADIIESESIPVYTPTENLKKVDAVIVTPASFFYEIEKELFPLMPDTHIISIETVVSYRR